MSFIDKITKICKEHDKVALFVDMDGTIVEYIVYHEGFITNETKELFLNAKPITSIIEKLEELNKIENLDIFILTLSKSNIIAKEKKEWLKRYLPFIDENNYIILIRENGDYDTETRSFVKANQMKEKLKEYNYVMLLDDEHKILRTTLNEIQNNGEVFHISSALV